MPDTPIDATTPSRRVLCIMREPFVDKLPGLVSLLTYLADHGDHVDILCPRHPDYLPPSFVSDHITYHGAIDEGVTTGRWRLPVTVRLVIEGIRLARSRRADAVLGTGRLGMLAARLVAFLARIPFVAFCIELPDRRGVPGQAPPLIAALERNSIRCAALVIIQDDHRGSLLVSEARANPQRIAVLPNCTRGKARSVPSDRIREHANLPPQATVILHSGGMGPWFISAPLAAATAAWPPDWALVFHTSFRVEGSPELAEVQRVAPSDRVHFLTEPLPTDELDTFISSADIGIALYSLESLGYRAEYMGLAAGKIGNYLKCGIPVVATAIPSLANFINRYRCGVCVETADQIQDAIETILADYDNFSTNALRCFDELWAPDRHCEDIAQRVRALTT